MSIAQTILDQLGGRRFIMMTGSNKFVDGGDYLRFSITRNHSTANRVEIKLNKYDLYDIEFFKVRGIDSRPINNYANVGAEELCAIFTNETGLYAAL